MQITLEAQTKWAFYLVEECAIDKSDIVMKALGAVNSTVELDRLPERFRVRSDWGYRWGTVELELSEERFIQMLSSADVWDVADYVKDWSVEQGEMDSQRIEEAPDMFVDFCDLASIIEENAWASETVEFRLQGVFRITDCSGITDPILAFWLSNAASSTDSVPCLVETGVAYPLQDLCEQVAESELHRARAQGDIEAQVCLAEAWASAAENPDLDPLNKLFDLNNLSLSQAFKWYLSAAELGDERAQIALAEMYDKGIGVDRNAVEALNWYLKAAEQGDPMAQATVAALYERGDGTEQNYMEALKWFSKAAEQDFPGAEDHANSILEQLAEAVISEAHGKS
ncbi:MAG: tetratricopeptide repeat protein [Synechococcus sp.]